MLTSIRFSSLTGCLLCVLFLPVLFPHTSSTFRAIPIIVAPQNGWTALSLARHHQHEDIVDLLESVGAEDPPS